MGLWSKVKRRAAKLIPNEVKRGVKAVVDPVLDLGSSVIKAVISPFTGGFDLPDTSINTGQTSAAIKAATIVDFNAANQAVPVLYGNRLETATIPVFIGTWGDNSADTSRQYLYMAAVISQGFHGSNSDIGASSSLNGAMGSLLSRMTINGKPVHLGGLTNTANPNYSQGYDGSTALNLQEADGGIFASGKGGVQPAQHSITKGTFANRLKIQYFDGSSDQPVSSLLNEHPEWSPTGESKLSGMHYVALRFLIQAADVTVSGSDGNGTYGNPYGGVPAVVVTTSGRSTPNIIHSKQADPGFEERFDTAYAGKQKTRFISYHVPVNEPDMDGAITAGGVVGVQQKDDVHRLSVPVQGFAGGPTDMEFQRFDKFQREKFSDGTTQPFNIHNILYDLGWTYDYVFFTPRSVGLAGDDSASGTSFGGVSILSGHFNSFNSLWLKHVGGGHYQFVNNLATSFKIRLTSGEMTFFGYNDDGLTTKRINGSYILDDIGSDTAEYTFFAPDDVLQNIENLRDAAGTGDMQFRVRVRETNQNDLYDITSLNLNSASGFISLGLTNLDSSKPADNFYSTVPLEAELYIEVGTGSGNIDKSPASYDVTFADGAYKTEGLMHEGYRPDNCVVEYVMDYMLNPNYGFGLTLDQIDRNSFINAAIALDRLPEFFDFDRTVFHLGGSEAGTVSIEVFDRNRYMYGENATTGAAVNGSAFHTLNNGYDRHFIIDTSNTFINNINQMLASVGAFLYYADGKFRIALENAGDPTDSERIPPITALPVTCTVTDDHILDSVGISTSAMNDRFNQIKVDYTNLANNSQPNSVLSPDPIDDSTDIRVNYLNEDGGKILEGSFSFPGIYDSVTAKKHATLLLKKSRGQPRINFQMSSIGINIAPGDFIRVDSEALGINDVFGVTDLSFNPDNTVTISGQKHVPDFYDVTDTGQIFEEQRQILKG